MPVSIYDIARVANVAPSTVSRALQDHPRVGKKTKDYIRQLAADMGYVPNTIAKSLSKQRTNAIGMIISEISGPFMGTIVEGAEKAAADLGYEVFVGVTGNDTQRELDIIQAFQQRRVDGLVIVASHLVRRYSKHLEQSLIPIVFINEQEEWDRIVTISVDDLKSAYTAVSYLNSLGHERIGFVGPAVVQNRTIIAYRAISKRCKQSVSNLTPAWCTQPLPKRICPKANRACDRSSMPEQRRSSATTI